MSLEEGFGENEFYNNSVTIDPSSDPANIPAGITLWGSSFGNYVHDNTLPIQGAYERSFDSSVQGYMSAFANRFESNTFIGGSAHWPFDSWSYKMNSSTDAPVPSVAPDYPCEGLIFRNNTLMTTGPAPVLAYSRNVTWEDNTGFLPPVGITYDGSIHYVDPASVGVTFVSYILPGAPSPPTTTIKRIDGSAAGSLKHLDGSAAGVIEKHVGGSWQ